MSSLQQELTEDTEKTRRSPEYASHQIYNCPKLETAGALTARGNTAWSAQSIQRILQNEKYCGDVLLQKTFTEDVLTGVHKKNTGQLPQYYIENYHEGIVSKQMFREAQAEIARRNSKSAANQRKRRWGRYNSKYALSERLFCGDCGSLYKRVTWNIHGRKQIVWRCVNRIEYGTKFCSSSPSIPEEELHRAILKAIQGLAANFTDEVAAQINGILHNIQTGESTKPNYRSSWSRPSRNLTDCWKCPWTSMRILRFWMTG